MNRTDGFPIADLDVGLLHDQKVITLARLRKDERQTAVDMTLYVSLVLESWAAGDRVTIDEALPAWWMADVEDCRVALRTAGLIDDESRLPETAWESWFIPAFDRRERRRESGAEGGRKSWASRRDKRRRSVAEASPNPSVLPAGRPSIQDRTGRGTSSPTSLAAIVDDVSASDATCDACHDPLLGEDWRIVKVNGGRAKNVHDRCMRLREAVS